MVYVTFSSPTGAVMTLDGASAKFGIDELRQRHNHVVVLLGVARTRSYCLINDVIATAMRESSEKGLMHVQREMMMTMACD